MTTISKNNIGKHFLYAKKNYCNFSYTIKCEDCWPYHVCDQYYNINVAQRNVLDLEVYIVNVGYIKEMHHDKSLRETF